MSTDVTGDVTGGVTDAGWEEILDRIEADLERAEARLSDPRAVAEEVDALAGIEPWAEPQPGTPLPAYLLDRARELIRRQEAVLVLLPRAQDRLRKQQAFTTRVRETTRSTGVTSVYIDATA